MTTHDIINLSKEIGNRPMDQIQARIALKSSILYNKPIEDILKAFNQRPEALIDALDHVLEDESNAEFQKRISSESLRIGRRIISELSNALCNKKEIETLYTDYYTLQQIAQTQDIQLHPSLDNIVLNSFGAYIFNQESKPQTPQEALLYIKNNIILPQ